MSNLLRKIKRKVLDYRRGTTRLQRENQSRYQTAFPSRGELADFKPPTISLVSTGRCNLSCDMCVTHSDKIPDDYPWAQNPTKDISLEVFKETVAKFKEATTVSIIGQGEPLLNKEFFDIVEYATAHQMKAKSFSNGTTLSPYIERILDSSLHTLSISLNGHDEPEYARLTGMAGSLFRVIQKNVKALVDARNRRHSPLVVNGSFILDKMNYRSVSQMIDVARALGIDGVLLCNFLPAQVDGFRVDERTITTDDKEIVRFLDEAVPVSERKWISLPTILDLHSQEKRCHCHWSQLRVNGNGEVSSCSMMLLNMEGHGSIRDDDVWNNDWFQSMRRKYLSPAKTDLDLPCNFCTENFGVDPWEDLDTYLNDKVTS